MATFGYPVSRPFLLQGVRVQVFQRHVLQQLPAGVAPLNLLDGDYLPYTDFGTAVVPAVDPAVAGGAPAPGTPDYGDAVAAYVAGAVPDVWQGQTVGFRDAFLQAGRAADPAAPAGAQTLLALEVLGFPTSAPAPDPRTPLLVAQRFQRGVLQYDATTGLTEPLLLADAFKAVLTGRFLPAALAAQSRGSPYALQYRPGLPGWLARPEALPATDLTQAFAPDAAGPGAAGAGAFDGLPGTPTLAAPALEPSPTAPLTPAPALGPPGIVATPGRHAGDAGDAGDGRRGAGGDARPAAPGGRGARAGGAAVGQDVLIRGRAFGDQPGQVLFTGKLAQPQVWSPTLIVVTVPQGAADGTVRIRRADGALSNAVGFAPATTPTPSPTGTTPSPTLTPSPTPTPARPAVAGIEPHFGAVGTTIQIKGSGFGPVTGTVLLGSQTAPVQLWSDSSVLVLVPGGADTQPQRTQRLRVVRPDGATGEPVACFIVSPGTPTPASAGVPNPTVSPVPASPTAIPPPASAC